MAFVSAQNRLVFSGSDTVASYNLKLLRLVYKTLNEALIKEANLRNRATPYWVIDPGRTGSGTLPLEEGGSDLNIFQYAYNTSSTDRGGVGLFMKSIDNEYLFLSASKQIEVKNNYGSSNYGIVINSIYPVTISDNYAVYTDNSHVYSNSSRNKGYFNEYSFYGLLASLSKTNFGSNDPKDAGFFSNTVLKPVSDSISGSSSSSASHTLPSNSDYLEIICAVDGKNIIIYKRETWNTSNKYPESILCIGDFIVPDDSGDTNSDVIFALQGYDTYSRMACMFSDKTGSTSLNANGSSFSFMRIPNMEVPYYLLPSSNINKVSYAPFQFYWENFSKDAVNTDLNSEGKGYKGSSDTDMIRVIGKTNLITLRNRYNNEWMPLIAWNNIIVMVKWDSSNDDLEM